MTCCVMNRACSQDTAIQKERCYSLTIAPTIEVECFELNWLISQNLGHNDSKLNEMTFFPTFPNLKPKETSKARLTF